MLHDTTLSSLYVAWMVICKWTVSLIDKIQDRGDVQCMKTYIQNLLNALLFKFGAIFCPVSPFVERLLSFTFGPHNFCLTNNPMAHLKCIECIHDDTRVTKTTWKGNFFQKRGTFWDLDWTFFRVWTGNPIFSWSPDSLGVEVSELADEGEQGPTS